MNEEVCEIELLLPPPQEIFLMLEETTVINGLPFKFLMRNQSPNSHHGIIVPVPIIRARKGELWVLHDKKEKPFVLWQEGEGLVLPIPQAPSMFVPMSQQALDGVRRELRSHQYGIAQKSLPGSHIQIQTLTREMGGGGKGGGVGQRVGEERRVEKSK